MSVKDDCLQEHSFRLVAGFRSRALFNDRKVCYSWIRWRWLLWGVTSRIRFEV